jgi:hypothetical protein
VLPFACWPSPRWRAWPGPTSAQRIGWSPGPGHPRRRWVLAMYTLRPRGSWSSPPTTPTRRAARDPGRATGYLLKDAPRQELIRAGRAAFAARRPVPGGRPAADGQLRQPPPRPQPAGAGRAGLIADGATTARPPPSCSSATPPSTPTCYTSTKSWAYATGPPPKPTGATYSPDPTPEGARWGPKQPTCRSWAPRRDER